MSDIAFEFFHFVVSLHPSGYPVKHMNSFYHSPNVLTRSSNATESLIASYANIFLPVPNFAGKNWNPVPFLAPFQNFRYRPSLSRYATTYAQYTFYLQRSLDITSFVFLMLDSWKLDPSVCRAAVGN